MSMICSVLSACYLLVTTYGHSCNSDMDCSGMNMFCRNQDNYGYPSTNYPMTTSNYGNCDCYDGYVYDYHNSSCKLGKRAFFCLKNKPKSFYGNSCTSSNS